MSDVDFDYQAEMKRLMLVLSALGRCAEELKAIRERIVEREAKRAARVLR